MSNTLEIVLRSNNKDTDEASAGQLLKEIFRNTMPKLTSGRIMIFCNATLFGQDVKDIDIICLGQLRNCVAQLNILDQGNKGHYVNSPVYINSFATTIELKKHSIERISINGTDLIVRYSQKRTYDSFHNVTEQSNKQKQALRNLFAQARIQSPYITNTIWLSSLLTQELLSLLTLPSGASLKTNILPSSFTFNDFAQIIADQMNTTFFNGAHHITAFRDDKSVAFDTVFNIFSAAKKTQGHLTRKRIELISQKQTSLLEVTGDQMIIYRGLAGTGKTISLLMSAFQLMEKKQARVLILSYNNALVGDIRRTLAFMEVPDEYGSHSISIKTSYSFIRRWLLKLNLLEEQFDFIDHYECYLKTLLEYIKADLLDCNEINKTKAFDFAYLEWDYVFIDESQDWLPIERDLLFSLYSPEQIILADGIDQLVRNQDRCNWAISLTKSKKAKIKKYNQNLRQKTNLAEFVNKFAKLSGNNSWYLRPTRSMVGGRIIISLKPYLESNLHPKLVRNLIDQDNSFYDLLFLVPPSLVNQDNMDRCFAMTDEFQDNDIRVWDGTKNSTRQEYTIDLESHRLVQYESCRGLEAWTVVCLDYDDYIQFKSDTYQEPDQIDELALESYDWRKTKSIFAWSILPLTRAISNLVITIRNPNSPVCALLHELYLDHPDIVEWIN